MESMKTALIPLNLLNQANQIDGQLQSNLHNVIVAKLKHERLNGKWEKEDFSDWEKQSTFKIIVENGSWVPMAIEFRSNLAIGHIFICNVKIKSKIEKKPHSNTN
jgi:hypothetical protein